MAGKIVLAHYLYSCGSTLDVVLQDGEIHVLDKDGLDPVCNAIAPGFRLSWRDSDNCDDEHVPDYWELGVLYQLGLGYAGS